MWPFPLVLLRKRRQNVPKINNYSGFRTRKAQVRKCNRFPRQKGGHGPRRSMRRPRKLGTGTRSWQNSMFGKKALASIAPYTFISHTKMPIFFRKGRSSSYNFESQPGKLVLETFSWDNNVNWVHRGTGTAPQMIPDRKWSPDWKWSPNWTANDPESQMIPDVDHKWSRRKTRNGMKFVPPVEVSFF